MNKLLVSFITALGLIGTPAFAADMAVKAPRPAPATWTGFYGGIQFGGGWRIPQSGSGWRPDTIGNGRTGYSNWRAIFSFAGMSGTASGTTPFTAGVGTQTTTATQDTDWYGTIRGRLGWLATPSLLLFGTGGFAYGRVDGSARYTIPEGFAVATIGPPPNFSFVCAANIPALCRLIICDRNRLDRMRWG